MTPSTALTTLTEQPNTALLRQALDEVTANVIADKAPETARKYKQRLDHFHEWLLKRERKVLDKRTIAAYRSQLERDGKSPSTINGHLVAVRALLNEAADMGLMDQRMAERAAGVDGVAQRGRRLGKWLSKHEAQKMLDAPDIDTLKGKRDRALLAVLLICGLRRSELAGLKAEQLLEREGHYVLGDIRGKHGRVRTIKLPVPVRRLIDEWLKASGRKTNDKSFVFVALRKGERVAGDAQISTQALYKLVKEYGEMIGHPDLAPHDLRRTFAKLARNGHSPIEEISLTLGHASIETTQLYLDSQINLDDSAPDRVGLNVG